MLKTLMDNPLHPLSGTGTIIVQQVEAAAKEDLEQQLLHLFACRALGLWIRELA